MRLSRHSTPPAAAAALLALVLTGPAPAAAAPKPPFTTSPGPANPHARFVASYTGSGSYKTRFHATPPNQGGKPDTNDAWDTSTESWKLRFRDALAVPTCGAPSGGSGDPCSAITGLSGASGPTELSGRVDHKHVDGIYRQFDRVVKCGLRKRPSATRTLDASLVVRYIPESDSIGISASDPIATAVSLFPSQCPKQGDSIDRILDFYAMPGFSFDSSYGPDRFLASSEVVIPAAVFHRSKTITIPLRDTPAGTPPRHCAVSDPSFERCTTGGAWRGVLTLSAAKPARAAKPVPAQAALAAKVKAPKSGQYKGRPRGKDMTLFVSGTEIQVAAFSFTCADTVGRTSIDSIALKKTPKGYAFSLVAHGSITFEDGQPDENGRVSIAGRFAAAGRSATGTFRVKSHRCHDTGSIKWRVSR
jgi:hypothetical protein